MQYSTPIAQRQWRTQLIMLTHQTKSIGKMPNGRQPCEPRHHRQSLFSNLIEAPQSLSPLHVLSNFSPSPLQEVGIDTRVLRLRSREPDRFVLHFLVFFAFSHNYFNENVRIVVRARRKPLELQGHVPNLPSTFSAHSKHICFS